MATTFDDLLLKGIRSGKVPARSKGAREWYRQEATKISTGRMELMASGIDTQTKTVDYGSMYFFFYNPKHKKTLPYYDTFPLIFPIGPAPKGFYGLNVHYIDLRSRARLMDALYSLLNNKAYDTTTRLQMSYKVLNSAAKYRWYKPCFKHYLNNKVMSNFMEVNVNEWDMALFLPVANFKKATQEEVWNESKKQMRRR